MNRLLLLSALRHGMRHPWQTWLTIAGIALGVAVILAVDLANQSARNAFLLSAESLSGRATHQILGSTQGIPDDVYRRLRVEMGLRRAAPVVDGVVKHGVDPLQLVGVDPFAEPPFRQLGTGTDRQAAKRLLTEPNTALLSGVTAERLGLSAGDRLTVQVPGGAAVLEVVGLLEADNPAILEGVVLVDISTAQELLGRGGRLDRIDLILQPSQVAWVKRALSPGLRLEVPATRTRVMAEMIQAFQTNLSAMSLLAILVGAFLIYNTMTFSVLRRRRLLGSLRVLGVTRGALFRLLILEALLLGLAGTALGVGLGIFTAHYLVQLVTRTINDLYFVVTVTRLMVDPVILAKGILVGVVVTLVAALLPAAEAARALPVEALRRSRLEARLARWLPWLTFAGVLGLLAGWLATAGMGGGLAAGFAGLFAIIMGYSLLTPIGVRGLGRLAGLLGRRRLVPRLAARGLDASMSRTAPAIAALSVAVAATLGVSIMITSFRATVADWLGYTLRSDIYVSTGDGVDGTLDARIGPLIESLPSVEEISRGRRVSVISPFGAVDLLALDMASKSFKGFRFVGETWDDLWAGYAAGELLLVSEPFAYRVGVGVGDRLRLETPRGPRELPVGGIFYDYGSERGVISLSHAAYRYLWQDEGVSTLGIYLRPGVDTAAALVQLRRTLGERTEGLRIRSNREIREQSLAVFDRTFTITRVLRLLAIGVAFIGVFSALMALQLERSREHAVMRANGMTPGQLSRLILMQTGMMGVYAGLLALPLGWLMSEVLIEVINRRAFGWSILGRLPGEAVAEALALAVTAALLAGVYPAWRIGRSRLVAALREE